MPFQSEKQKKWMWANKPEMAREWTSKYGSKIEAKKGTMAKKDKNWIQKATKNMRKDKPCTGKKFGGPTCPPGTRRYNLAKTFRKMNKAKHGKYINIPTPHADIAKYLTKSGVVEGPKGDDTFWRKKGSTMKNKDQKRGLGGIGSKGGSKKLKPNLKIIDGTKVIIIGKDTGPTYRPGWKPQLSVKTAKKGTFSSIDTDRILAQMKVRHSGGMPPATKYKKYLKSLGKATSSRFPANAFTAGKTALGAAQLKAHLKTKLPKAATARLGDAGMLKRITKMLTKTPIRRAALAASAITGAYELGKTKIKKKKVQKKATGGEIIIGRGVDIDLL